MRRIFRGRERLAVRSKAVCPQLGTFQRSLLLGGRFRAGLFAGQRSLDIPVSAFQWPRAAEVGRRFRVV